MKSRLVLHSLAAALVVAAFSLASEKGIRSNPVPATQSDPRIGGDGDTVFQFSQAPHQTSAKSTLSRPRREWIRGQVYDSATGEGLRYVDLVITTSTGAKETETFPDGKFVVPINPRDTGDFALTVSRFGYSNWHGEIEQGSTVSLALEPRQMDFERTRKQLGIDPAF